MANLRTDTKIYTENLRTAMDIINAIEAIEKVQFESDNYKAELIVELWAYEKKTLGNLYRLSDWTQEVNWEK